MDGWRWAAAGAVLWAIAGCQTPQAVTALERESRMLEDQVYMLQDELDRSQEELRACQSQSARAPRPAEAPARPSAEAEAPGLPPLRGPRLTPENGKSPVDIKSLQLPDVEVPGQPLPSGTFPKTLVPPNGGAPPGPGTKPSAYWRGPYSPYSQDPRYARDPRYVYGQGYAGYDLRPRRLPPPDDARSRRREDSQVIPAEAFALDPRADNTRVKRITLNRKMTGGYDRNARFSDSGVTALVEPRDAQGRLAPVAGPISVAVLDRARSGGAGEVARWDFTAEQTASLYRKTAYGEGIYLEMPWPGSPPDHGHLLMFVRYTTQDGRKLETSCQFDVPVSPHRQQGWAPLSPPVLEPPRTATTGSWQRKSSWADDAPAPSAVPEDRPGDDPPAAAKPKRPVWSPFRP